MLRTMVVLGIIAAAVGIAGFAEATSSKSTDLASRLTVSPDSYPVISIRDEFGKTSGKMFVGDTRTLCALSKNIFTNQVMILIPSDASDIEEQRTADHCEVARQKYAEELFRPAA